MKLHLLLLFVLFAVASGKRDAKEKKVTPEDIANFGATFRVDIQANFENGVAMKPDEHDLLFLRNMMKALIQVDVLTGGSYGGIVPDFNVAYEKYGSGTIIDNMGNLASRPAPAAIMQHMKPEDKLTDIVYDSVIDETKGTDDEADERRLELVRKLKEEKSLARGLRGGGETQEANSLEGWTLIDLGFTGNGPREGDGRELLATIDCGVRGTCGASWCSTFCATSDRRRRLSVDGESDSPSYTPSAKPSSSPSGTPSGAPSTAPSLAPSSAPSSGHPSATPSYAPSAAPSSTPTSSPTEKSDIEVYREKVRAMESRVTKQLTEKLRFLARHEKVKCLGNYWELEVKVTSNIVEVVKALVDEDN